MKVGEIGFVIEHEGEYIGRRTNAGEKPFRSYEDAQRCLQQRVWNATKDRFESRPDSRWDGATIVPVKLVAVKMEVA